MHGFTTDDLVVAIEMYMWTTVKTTCQSGNEREEMDADDELNTLMHFVFGSGSGNNLSLE